MRHLLIVLVSIFCVSHVGAEPESFTVLEESFNTVNKGALAKRLIRNTYVDLAKGKGPDGSDAIRVAYEGFERGSKRVILRYPLEKGIEHAVVSFDVLFDKDFQWTLGGKLHGLGPMKPITGGKSRQLGQWSARVVFKAEGKCASYIYDQSYHKKYGIGSTSTKPVFTKGVWHHVSLEVKLNTPGKHDGVAKILVDGQIVVSDRDVIFRKRGGADTQIRNFLFSTFHGGHKPKWSPVNGQGNPKTVFAYFDNFKVVSLPSIRLPIGQSED